jgi:leukotriene-A4 hydrolase
MRLLSLSEHSGQSYTVVAVLALACSSRAAAADLEPIQPSLDYHSFANIEQFRVTRVELNLRVDFHNKVLFGAAALEIKRLDPRATQLVLDTRDLDIRDVSERPSNVLGALSKTETTWVSRPFHLDKSDPILGSPLVIELPPLKKSTETIKIEYVTSPAAPGLVWLGEPQTLGNHHPFLFSLSSPIGARSWIPLQDTPQVRASFSALIHTDNDVLAVMSAKNDPKAKHNGEYSFSQSDPIPSSLIALAIGDLRFKELGPRTGIYAEKPLAGAAAKEFADAEALLRAGERLFGPYRWDRFDIVVPLPRFPVAEVGDPDAAFVSPSTITGDRSRESVVAQALAEGWSGGLVSNATWRDAWIGAGLAVYMSSRIVEAVYGAQRAGAERARELSSLREELARLDPADQVLAADFRRRDPGAASRRSADEKAGLLFAYLDGKFGRERFDPFLKAYFDHFALKSVSTDQFLGYLKDNLLDRYPGIVSPAQVAAWVMSPGIPADAPFPASNGLDSVDAARSAWLAGKFAAKKLDTRGWLTPQWTYFLDHLPAPLRKDQLADLDQAFGFTRTANAEIAGAWLLLVIRSSYQPGYTRLEQYLQTTGRQSLIEPLYVELMKTPAGATLAKRVYALAKPAYSARTAVALDAIITPASESQDDE